MFERPQGGELAVLVHVDFSTARCQEELDEFQELVTSAGAESIDLITATRRTPEAKYFVGSGKAEEIKTAVLANHAQIVIINHALSPAQQRNLERLFECRVIDRTGLILDIFAQRARTFEGKLQVELAQLQHLSTRLIRGWTHLERQKGGIGLRGPGETQLETDRRLIRGRIKHLLKRLEKVRSQRHQGRRSRRRAALPTISLVGYTNAGKSTLFNHLTGADCYVADQLFATLDPTLRRIAVKNFGDIILADTVGFIRHLPHDLVDAFHATLEESKEADLLIHVIDATDPRRHTHIEQVEDVLTLIGAENVEQIQVLNKIDDLDHGEPRIERDKFNKIRRVWVSAKTGEGIDLLLQAMAELLSGEIVAKTICLTPQQARLRSKFYDLGCVLNERIDQDGNYFLSIRLSRKDYQQLMK